MIDQRQLQFFGDFAIRVTDCSQAGDVIDGHQHHYPHVTSIDRGSFRYRIERREGDSAALVGEGVLRQGDRLPIEAELFHRFEALEDGSRLSCWFLHRDRNGRPTGTPNAGGAGKAYT